MTDTARFVVFMASALLLFVALLRFSVRRRSLLPSLRGTVAIAFIVVVLGMIFTRYSPCFSPASMVDLLRSARAHHGSPPANITPDVSFRDLSVPSSSRRIAPVIQVFLSLLVGWHDYMPFPVYLPAIAELERRLAGGYPLPRAMR